jgi:multidrug efflux system membrane fusion protein
MSRFWKIALTVVALVVVALVVWFGVLHKKGGRPGAKAQGSGQGADAAPVPVTVVPVTRQDVPVFLSALGTAQALNTVTVRPQVGGQLMKLNFKEGQEVKKGDVIAEIDPRTIQANLDQARATLAQNQALLGTARSNLKRSVDLNATQQYVSKADVVTQQNLVNQYVGTVAGAQGAIRAAEVQLGFTKVIAPIDGVAGIRAVDAGNIVTTTDSIVVITQLHPIYVTFKLPTQNLGQVRAALTSGDAPVTVRDKADSHVVAADGKLDVIDNQIDSTTSQFAVRSVFPNSKTELWPGQFVNVQLKVGTVSNGLVVPSQAVQRGPDGDYVYQVQGDNTVKMQPIVTGTEVGESHVLVTEGLKEGEKVVTEGQFRLKPGSKVQPLAPGQVPATPTADELNKSKQTGNRRGGGGGGPR